MSDDVTMGEVVRRLDSIAAQLAQITSTLAADKRHYETVFITKELHNTQLAAIGSRIQEVEKDVEDGKKSLAAQQDRNRQLVFAIIGVAIPALVSIVLALLGTQGGVG